MQQITRAGPPPSRGCRPAIRCSVVPINVPSPSPQAASPEGDPGGAAPPPLPRRALLRGACVGGAYALAGRAIFAADAASARGGASAADLARALEERVVEFALPNGMRFLVAERRAAPVVSFHTYADVGAFDEEDGVTGVAHLLEHLAFKGTPRIGTKDFATEAPLLDAMDEGAPARLTARAPGCSTYA